MYDNLPTISEYIESKPDLRCKIIAIDNVIAVLELKLLDAVDSAVYEELQLDDGQGKMRTKYRNITDVTKGILALEQIKQRYVNRLNGRVRVFRGGNF